LLKKTQPRTKHEVYRMTRCWVMAIWSLAHSGRRTDTGYRRPETTRDFIFCPMLLCIALDRQQELQEQKPS